MDEEETDGERLARLGTDAQLWAKEWVALAASLLARSNSNPLTLLDEGWMISWFANAIMAGFDEGRRSLFARDELHCLVMMTAALRESSLRLEFPDVDADMLLIKLKSLNPVRYYLGIDDAITTEETAAPSEPRADGG